jgi:flagellar biogenesis protein FliO
MAKEIIKIAGQMILYILILVALVFVFYPQNSKERTNSVTQTSRVSIMKNQ